MKRFERILIKIIMAQFLIMILAQIFLQHSAVKPYLSKVVQYEGVGKWTISEWIETFGR